ncbi:RNA polymerase sigma-E factor [Aquisphaera giovannonii]|uniref:RNA polymerase sigma-E factor n=1 Tax=Aquisphaera giovannonii TaxID=406548 RepID=A0A5B9VV29_9BACT|nr:sigma factor-like helix-turn-helix DNA-binding protein [Aquisphaera giovannonii]QEH31954.1 RNA polymerase sigma-E factor [Aquisphaera giovannonii]
MTPSGDADITDPGSLFDRFRERLRRTVRLRLDRRLVGVVDSSEVLQGARDEAVRREGEMGDAADRFLWFREVVVGVLARLERERFGDDVRRDVSLYRGSLPEATTVSLAAHLMGIPDGDDDRAAERARHKLVLQDALNALEVGDREVLTLRHCEQLSNQETAAALGLSAAQASEAYIRALKRISPVLASIKRLQG